MQNISFKPIEHEDYPGFYKIPNIDFLVINKNGECLNIEKQTFLTLQNSKIGYFRFRIKRNGVQYAWYQHRLLALAFLAVPSKYNKTANELEVNHKDAVKTNNTLENLEWVNGHDNLKHARENNLIKDNIRVISRNILTNEITEHYSILQCSKKFNIWPIVLKRRLDNKQAMYHVKDWCVFKLKDDVTPWVDIPVEYRRQNSWDITFYWQVINIKNNQEFLFNNIPEVCNQLNISVNLFKKIRNKNFLFNEWRINKKIKNLNEKIFGLCEYTEKKLSEKISLVCKNINSNTVKIYDSLYDAANDTGVKKATISYGLKNKTEYKFKNFIFYRASAYFK